MVGFFSLSQKMFNFFVSFCSTIISFFRNNAVEPLKYSANRKPLIFGSGYNICMFEINKANVQNSFDVKHSSYKQSNITVEKARTYLAIQELLCGILPREQLYDTSSLIIVMPSSSDEYNPQYIQSIISSTIGLDVLEKNCSWNYKAHSLLRKYVACVVCHFPKSFHLSVSSTNIVS